MNSHTTTAATGTATDIDPLTNPSQRDHEKGLAETSRGASTYNRQELGGYGPPHRARANPAPLGLFSFATTTLLFSLINVHARHLNHLQQNIAVGMSFALGGLAQFVAGIFEFCVGNTFGMTAFCGYGAFSLAIAISLWPSSGVLIAYEANPADRYQLNAAIGLFLICWFVFTFMLFLATFRSTIGLVSLFSFFWLTFLLLAIGYWRDQDGVIKAGGWMGIITSLIAYYVGLHSLLMIENAPFQVPNPVLFDKRA
ncbi:hypothetical protein IAU60_004440 [Kwoniella sp. DSM 27419]